ncbi:F-box/LRR-repeat protein 4-like [Liolophura sinensis]|uniref:F-box/LRR-repeat protein 4-like n=1 Tax=Liolophura sinensis TaxID=3198878 RepID=UPI003158670C
MATIVQFADDVSSFSSQYGSEMGMSYTVSNLVRQTNIYPSYGDFTQACVFRTYGPWWEICPSAAKPSGRHHETFRSQDFVELVFKERVIPLSIEIFETYNPGTVVKILACDNQSGTDVDSGNVKWVTLWEGPPQAPEPKSRVTSPPLKRVNFCTDLIRLEFCHSLCPYYTELDAVRLTGTAPTSDEPGPGCHGDDILPGISQMSLQDDDTRQTDGAEEETGNNIKLQKDNVYFSMLPEEVIQLILSYLDTVSLCRLAQTCKLLRTHCYDPMQFTELNLKPFWAQVNDNAMMSLQSRCSHCQKLDLSWTGNHGLISSKGIEGLLSVCGATLTCLRLASCGLVNSSVILRLSSLCPALQELDLRSCQEVGSPGLSSLGKLTSLCRLNLYRTQVDAMAVKKIVRGCQKLQHLNLGSCICLSQHDTLMEEIATNCRGLKSLDVWRWKSLSEVGLTALAENCPLLEEIDLGWISTLRSSTGCYRILPKHCPKLKKLFFTANRSVCDDDLDMIAERCPDLEQLDILGTREVSLASAESAHYKLSIKTTATYGNIFYARGTYYDFERLYIENGILHYFLFNPTRYGIGGTYGIHVEGQGVLANGSLGPISIADDRWHTVEFFRNTRLPGMNRTSSGLVLDDHKNVDSRPRKNVAIKPPFYIGGSPVHEGFQGIIKDFEEVRNNFIFHETSQPMNVKHYREPPC